MALKVGQVLMGIEQKGEDTLGRGLEETATGVGGKPPSVFIGKAARWVSV